MDSLVTRQISDNRGGTEDVLGRWSVRRITDNEGNEIGTEREWNEYKSEELQSLGDEYETNGPSGAPKVLAFVHIKNGNISLSFYILKKSSVEASNVYTGNGDDYPETKYVKRWQYVDLFNNIYLGADAPINSITQRFDNSKGMNATYSASTSFNVEELFNNNREVKSELLGPAFAIIAFDKGDEITLEESKNYDNSNRDTFSMLIPVKLSNPRCIYVNKDKYKAISIPKYLTYQEETALITQMTQKKIEYYTQLTPKKKEYDAKKKDTDEKNNKLESEIQNIKENREKKITEINKEYFRKETKIQKYKLSADYLNDESLIKEYKEKIDENKKELKNMADEINSNTELKKMADEIRDIYNELKKYPQPRIYKGNGGADAPIFFIEPDFSPSSLVRLVYDSATPSSGGRRHRSRKSKKSMKIKKRYIRSRKYSKKYRRHSYRK